MIDGICGIYRRSSELAHEDLPDCRRMIGAAPHWSRAGVSFRRSARSTGAALSMFESDAPAAPENPDLLVAFLVVSLIPVHY